MLGSKSDALARLEGTLKNARVLPQFQLTLKEWHRHPQAVLENLDRLTWSTGPLIVRSSASGEDGRSSSLAGRFASIGNVRGRPQLSRAISQVALSFGHGAKKHQVFIQPFLKKVRMSGVAFSHDPNTGGPYFVVNYDETSGSASAVTGGRSADTRVFYCARSRVRSAPGKLRRVLDLLVELESALGEKALDIEFAFNLNDELFLLQVRSLAILRPAVDAEKDQPKILTRIEQKIKELSRPHPYLLGSRAIFGVMPDWNPAEMIGVRPRPLAMSLYKDLITDHIWAYQRDNYGYRNLRSFPLLVDFCGLPYIDVRVSFNSFIPVDLEPSLARRLVDYYLVRLADNPQRHDKVEFEILFSCYTLDLPERLQPLRRYGFKAADLEKISKSLRGLTNRIIHEKHGLWRADLDKIESLESRRLSIRKSSLDPVSKIYWILEDCKRYGTLPFAGLARAAFIAVQSLRSLEAMGIFSKEDTASFMAGLDTVSSGLSRDLEKLPKKEFLRRYGHLRPGSYDILSSRYDETPEKYFDWHRKRAGSGRERRSFKLTSKQALRLQELLKKHGLEHDTESFFLFIRRAIEGRERAKFIFSRSLSDALSLIKSLAVQAGFSCDDASFLDIGSVQSLYASSRDLTQVLRTSIEEGKKRYALVTRVALPPLLVSAKQVGCFELPSCEPNFITLGSATGAVCFERDKKKRLSGSILFLPSADPGYDWIFSHDIAGFITMYGGANSHMAVRALEMRIPAVIGAGEKFFREWSSARRIQLDCAKRQVTVLS